MSTSRRIPRRLPSSRSSPLHRGANCKQWGTPAAATRSSRPETASRSASSRYAQTPLRVGTATPVTPPTAPGVRWVQPAGNSDDEVLPYRGEASTRSYGIDSDWQTLWAIVITSNSYPRPSCRFDRNPALWLTGSAGILQTRPRVSLIDQRGSLHSGLPGLLVFVQSGRAVEARGHCWGALSAVGFVAR